MSLKMMTILTMMTGIITTTIERFSRLSRIKKLQLTLWVIAVLVLCIMDQDYFIVLESADPGGTIEIKQTKTSPPMTTTTTTTKPKKLSRKPKSSTTTTITPVDTTKDVVPGAEEEEDEKPSSSSSTTTTTTTTSPPESPTTTISQTAGGATNTNVPPTTTTTRIPSKEGKHPPIGSNSIDELSSFTSSSNNSNKNFTIRMAPKIYQGKTLDELPPAAQTFLQAHCDFHHVKEQWYPTDTTASTTEESATTSTDHPSWKQRAPYAIIAGVWNAGVTSLQQTLQQHPQVASISGDFFLPRNFRRYYYSSKINDDNNNNNNNSPTSRGVGGGGVVKVLSARERMYAQATYRKFRATATATTRTTTSKRREEEGEESTSSSSFFIAIDVSPGYLFHAEQTMTSIQCVSPWSKFIIILNDPVERVYKQWVYAQVHSRLRLSLEDWIAQDLSIMQSAGLLGNIPNVTTTGTPPSSGGTKKKLRYRRRLFSDTDEERRAWKVYQSKPNPSSVIGRSMYVLQLEEWFDTLRSVGKEPFQEVFLMKSELWESQPQEEYRNILNFLGLSQSSPQQQQQYGDISTTYLENSIQYPPMNHTTKIFLQDFFEPYNQRLQTLLKQNGFS